MILGDWTVAADNGKTPNKQTWDPAEPNGLMAINSACIYVSQPISHLAPNTQYQWKVSTEDNWIVNFGCNGTKNIIIIEKI